MIRVPKPELVWLQNDFIMLERLTIKSLMKVKAVLSLSFDVGTHITLLTRPMSIFIYNILQQKLGRLLLWVLRTENILKKQV